MKGKDVLKDLITLIGSNINTTYNSISTLDLIVQTKGGWEGWLQCELSLHLYKKYSNISNWTIFREQNSYSNNSLRSDIEINDGNSYTIVELKALGLGRFNGDNDSFEPFAADVKKDIDKINKVLPNRKPCDFCSFVVIPAYKNTQSFTINSVLLQKTTKNYTTSMDLSQKGYYIFSYITPLK